MNSKAKTAATLAILLSCTAVAHATVATASATISDLEWQVVDLNPQDGIAPAFSVDNTSITSEAAVNDAGEIFGSSAGGLTIGKYHDAGNWSTVTSPANTVAGTSMTAVASTPQPYKAESVNELYGTFTLSPGAAVYLSSDVHLSLQNTGDNASSYAILRLSDEDYWTHVSAPDLTLTTPGIADQHLAAYYANTGTSTVTGTFSIWTDVNAAAPVPEPGSAALLLAGLGLLGARALRRRRI